MHAPKSKKTKFDMYFLKKNRIFGVLYLLIFTGMVAWAFLQNTSRPVTRPARLAQSRAPRILNQPRTARATSDFRAVVDLCQLSAIMAKAAPISSKPGKITILHATHALRLWGRGPGLVSGRFSPHGEVDDLYVVAGPEILDILVSEEEFLKMYPASVPLLSRDSRGIKVRANGGSPSASETSNWPDCERHIDKNISVFGEIDLHSNFPASSEGKLGTISDMIRSSLWNFTPSQEIEFTCKAYLYYLETDTEWTTKRGISFDLKSLVKMQTRRNWAETSCAGTHICHNLALAMAIDRDEPFLGEELRNELANKLIEYSTALEKFQREDGSWPSGWMVGSEETRLSELEGERIARLRVAGHHLEWIAIAPPELRPKKDTIVKAIMYAQKEFAEWSYSDIKNSYPVITHGARALLLLSGRHSKDFTSYVNRALGPQVR